MEPQEQTDNESPDPVSDELYNVELDIYKGPLDLLLYLIRRAEVDIYDIPVAKITRQYLAYIDLMQDVNITIAGEFVLVAATLMEIKSKMLLPRAEPDDLDGEEEDPRTELVRQLLEYKRFKDAALALGDAADEQSKKFPRPPPHRPSPPIDADEEQQDVLGNVSLWDLLTAFSKVLKETSLGGPHTIYDTDKPLKYFMLVVLEALREQGKMRFAELFVDAEDRAEVIGVFLALLELMRLRRAKAEQAKPFGEIYITVGEDYSQEELPDDQATGYAAQSGNDAPPQTAGDAPPGSEKELTQ